VSRPKQLLRIGARLFTVAAEERVGIGFQRAALGRDRALAFTQAAVPGGRSESFHGSCSFRVVQVLQLPACQPAGSNRSMAATMRWVRLRAKGIARYAVLAAIGQPMAKADHHRITKSFRQPILKNVNTPLTIKAMMAVITTGKMNLALPSMRPSELLH